MKYQINSLEDAAALLPKKKPVTTDEYAEVKPVVMGVLEATLRFAHLQYKLKKPITLQETGEIFGTFMDLENFKYHAKKFEKKLGFPVFTRGTKKKAVIPAKSPEARGRGKFKGDPNRDQIISAIDTALGLHSGKRIVEFSELMPRIHALSPASKRLYPDKLLRVVKGRIKAKGIKIRVSTFTTPGVVRRTGNYRRRI